MKEKFEFSYEQYPDDSSLTASDLHLLKKAREITKQAYAPYSNFHVGAVAKLSNGKYVSGTNQENASYPVGICAERVLLGNAATLFPGKAVESIAISYHSDSLENNSPVSPCGMCRQALLEYEIRTESPIRVILSGLTGPVQIIDSARQLLPFAFTSKQLK